MTRCRVAEDELAHDHAQVEITPEMEREEARDKFGALMLQVAEMVEVLFRDENFKPDEDDLHALEHLNSELKYYEKVKKL
jgi:hypothetical protein